MSSVEILSDMGNSLKKFGFTVSEHSNIRSNCFDFVARKKELLFLIKDFRNVGAISGECASELHMISNKLSAVPLFIGFSAPKNPMEDDAVYMRHDICAITFKTFINAIVNGEHPLIEVGPGGFHVYLNREMIKKRRRKLCLSLGELASMVGVSRRAVYGYERGLAKATVSIALKLETVLGVPIVHHIDIVTRRRHRHVAMPRQPVENPFLHRVLKKLKALGVSTAVTKRAPFDFIVCDDEGNRIIGDAFKRGEWAVPYRIRLTNSVAKVARVHPLFIVEERGVGEGFRTVHWEELSKFRALRDLFESYCYR